MTTKTLAEQTAADVLRALIVEYADTLYQAGMDDASDWADRHRDGKRKREDAKGLMAQINAALALPQAAPVAVPDLDKFCCGYARIKDGEYKLASMRGNSVMSDGKLHPIYALPDELIERIHTAAQAKDITPPAPGVPTPLPEPTVPEAMAVVTKALRDDPGYAWSWHCNITMAMVDEGVDHAAAEHGSQRFLNLLCPGPSLVPAHPLRQKVPTQAVGEVGE